VPRYVDHEQRRRDVTEIAARLVASEGLSALTARRVAESAGQSTTVVSHYFADMRELLHETYSLAVDRSRARVESVLDADPTDIVGLAEALLPLDAQRRADWRVWLSFWAEALGSPDFADEQRRRVRTSADRFCACLTNLRAAGRLRAEIDTRRAGDRLSALIIGVATEATFDPRKWTTARQREAIQDHLALIGFTHRKDSPCPS
jgi:AcrR family transcriptional regulator